ncbi:hypothetical protein [Noviherbaspirillum sp. Root189]|uniref:hypothetical protein n=1 Tax=Noviherbaspirillum sp. Root189 TaxID=1736487 RepID=UPI00070B1FAC|nr:hypothetical protein [Noviherbaspirillum sp. Root189]KRB88948.1 hypothetical protein ASE07_02065 [Noviherbaspirillum sp. Root189]
MSSKQWLAVVAWVVVPMTATAQQKQAQFAPTDANAPITSMGYESAFKGYRASGDEEKTPDKVWRSANEEMGRLGGHVGQIKADASQPVVKHGADAEVPMEGTPADHRTHH